VVQKIMSVLPPTTLVIIILGTAVSARAQETFAGPWTMTLVSMEVTVHSWGANCGEKPKSYSQAKQKPVDVREENGQLILSGGGARTDACGSLNPKVRTLSASRLPGKWSRVCQTAKDDPKFERGVYTLVASGKHKLEYTAVSKFDWTLKGDHCVASTKERRIYVRQKKALPPAEEKVSEAESPLSPETVVPGCESPGPVKWVTVSPKKTRLGPGQSTCLEVSVRDQKGCVIDKKPSWIVTQNGVVVNGLISGSGCFHAGETAADAEGRYMVTARAGGKSATAEIDVVFPELDGLLAARLKPLEESDTEKPSSVKENQVSAEDEPYREAKPRPPTPSGARMAAQTTTPESSGDRALWVLLIVMVIGIGTIALIFFLRRQPLTNLEDQKELDDWPEEAPEDRIKLTDNIALTSESVILTKRCVQCGGIFDSDARFCPYDKSELVATVTPSKAPEAGMVCPKCSRGYGADARFCPHDSEPLVSYATWREKKDK
jgi:hypothetical protein